VTPLRCLLVAACALALAASAAADSRGRAIYLGHEALPARIVGQDFALPPQASRCVNCHVPAGGAPALSAASLTRPMARRGGPPSRYDAVALCTLLRSGIDPAHVMIQRSMPRYVVDEADCRALWRHLTQ
jgi:hypothetical protein